MRSLRRALIVGAAATAVLLGVSSAAQAGTDATSTTTGSWSRFISYGDKFENCDTFNDFMISYVQYQYIRIDGTLQTGSHYNPGNNGDCFAWDHDFGEGRTVWFRSCRDIPLQTDNCDAWRTGIA